jgi:hypothetical protein
MLTLTLGMNPMLHANGGPGMRVWVVSDVANGKNARDRRFEAFIDDDPATLLRARTPNRATGDAWVLRRLRGSKSSRSPESRSTVFVTVSMESTRAHN